MREYRRSLARYQVRPRIIINDIIVIGGSRPLIKTYRRNNMTTNNVPAANYTEPPKPAFPATDKSSQDSAGLGNGGK